MCELKIFFGEHICTSVYVLEDFEMQQQSFDNKKYLKILCVKMLCVTKA